MPFPKVDLGHKFEFCAVIDVETGGFSREKNPLLEVGALLVDQHLEIVDSIHFYVFPDLCLKIEDGAAEVNGYRPENWGVFPVGHVITEDQQKNIFGPMVQRQEVDQRLLDWIGAHQGVVGSAYNAPFDKAWIQHHAPKFSQRLKPDWVCSMAAIKKVYTDRGIKVEKGMAKLGAVCDGFKYEALTGEKWARHTALDDCYAARFVMAVAAMHNAWG